MASRTSMHIHLSGNRAHAIFSFAVLLVLAALRFSRRRSRRRFRFAGPAVGNALQTVHIFVDPGVRFVISQTLEETSEDYNEEDSADTAIHFERQLRRIRRGDKVDRLTIRMRQKE
jgi:hypothetical protein